MYLESETNTRKIKKNKGDFKMKKSMEMYTELIKKELNEVGYICDSDNTDRFIDNLIATTSGYEGKKFDELLELIHTYILATVKCVSTVKNGEYIAYYYTDDKDFEDVTELKEFYNLTEEEEAEEETEEFYRMLNEEMKRESLEMKKFTRKYNRIGRSINGFSEDLLFIDDVNEVIYFIPCRSSSWYSFQDLRAEKEKTFKTKKEIKKMFLDLQNIYNYKVLSLEEAKAYLNK